jgi:hypothetical protein
MKKMVFLLIVLIMHISSGASGQILNIKNFLDKCPNNDPVYSQIIEDFKIRNNGILVDTAHIACSEPISQMDVSDYTNELIILQGLRVIYYMDNFRRGHLPWTSENLYDWLKSTVQGINIGSGPPNCCTQYEDGLYFDIKALDDYGRNACRYWIGIANNITLYFHEARHVGGGFGHTSCCGIEGGCDQYFDEVNLSPYGMQWWLHWAWLTGYLNVGFSCLEQNEAMKIANIHLGRCNDMASRICENQPPEVTMPVDPGGPCLDNNTSTSSSITSSISTTTTSALSSFCPMEVICGEQSEEVAALRWYRDNVLSQTPEGRELIKLYYLWSPVIVRAMESDVEFKEEVKQMIDSVLAMLEE